MATLPKVNLTAQAHSCYVKFVEGSVVVDFSLTANWIKRFAGSYELSSGFYNGKGRPLGKNQLVRARELRRELLPQFEQQLLDAGWRVETVEYAGQTERLWWPPKERG